MTPAGRTGRRPLRNSGEDPADPGGPSVEKYSNVQRITPVYDAVVENGIDRAVFASSNPDIGGYNAANGDSKGTTAATLT